MSEQTNFTSSELIYLFLDGEADNVQRTVLFNAMAEDSGLQEEFQDAMRIRAVAQKQAMAIVPSVLLTQQVFAKAGFGTAASVKAAGMLSSSVGAGSGAGSVGTIGTFVSALKGLFSPLVAATGAAVVTGVVMYNVNQSKLNAMQTQADAEIAAAHQQQAAALAQATPSQATPITIIKKVPVYIHAPSAPQNDVAANPPQANTANAAPAAGAGILPADTVTKTAAAATPAPQQITPVAFASLNTQYIVGTSVTPVYEKEDMASLVSVNDRTQSNFIAYARGIMNVQLYPQRPFASNANALLDNVSLGLLRRVNENSSVGVEIGQEMFPLYVLDSRKQEYNLRPSLFWGGAAFRYVPSPEDMLSPYTQVLIGGSRTGPIGKLALGMEWHASGNILFSLAVEGTALLYNDGNALSTTGKLGVTPSVAILF